MRVFYLVITGLFILLSPHCPQAKTINYPCSGAPGSYRINPDGSEGGFVAASATVDSSIFIEINASVCEKAIVIEGVKLKGEVEVSGRATVRGKVVVQDRAKIYGESYIINPNGSELLVKDMAKIYGNSFLQGSVVVGGFSEVFGWGKIIDFAQILGSSRVCGSSVIRDFDIIQDDNTFCNQKKNKE